MKRDWGRVIVGTRLEKMVENQFVFAWSHLITKGLRKGDAFLLAKDKTAHQAANELARTLLKSDYDSICFIDSDWDGGPTFVEELRSVEEGWEFDIFQAFYTRRGWPPEAIWFKTTELGDLMQCLVWKDNNTEETALAGLHSVLIRREVFEKIKTASPEIPLDEFDFFWYPRHKIMSEDAAFSREAREFGFRIGSTTVVKAGHISRVTTGWETYQEYLHLSGIADKWQQALDLVALIARYTGESPETVTARVVRGSENVKEGFERHGLISGDGDPRKLKEFYGAEDSGYLYELIGWNNTPLYQASVAPLKKMEGNHVLVVGAGIGGEVEALKEKNIVFAFELPGALRDFLLWRYRGDDRVQIYTEPDDLRQIYPGPIFDLIVAIDTIEHFHPVEFESTMNAMLSLLKPNGQLYFRNNFGQIENYPMHFDHKEAYAAWIEKSDLELYAGYDTGVEIYRRKVKDAEEEAARHISVQK